MTSIKKQPPPIVFIGLAVMIVSGLALLNGKFNQPFPNPLSSSSVSSDHNTSIRISRGESLLIPADSSPEKQAGVKAFAKGEFRKAQTYFESARRQRRNVPDTLIKLWNAKIQAEPHLTIAVSVPIGSNLNIAQEILRGVAQAQDEINTQGGIQGQKLEVVIADDQNNPHLAGQVATALVNKPQVLAVVGHNASDASLAAAPIYQQAGLVMVSPTSFANGLSGFGPYIFRAVPSVRFLAEPLASYSLQKAQKKRLAVCFDSQAKDNLSFKDEFIASFSATGGQMVDIACDFAAPTFDPNQAVRSALQSGVEGLLLAPHVDRLDRALAVAQSANGRLMLIGSSTLYTFKTLQVGRQAVDGLVLSIPAYASPAFLENAYQLWGAEVKTWRTAAAYDATRAIIAGLQHSATRSGLQQALIAPSFSTMGAGRTIHFLPSGDRTSPPALVKVKSKGSKYEFALLE